MCYNVKYALTISAYLGGVIMSLRIKVKILYRMIGKLNLYLSICNSESKRVITEINKIEELIQEIKSDAENK